MKTDKQKKPNKTGCCCGKYLRNKYLLHINVLLVLECFTVDYELITTLVCLYLCLDDLGGDLFLHHPQLVSRDYLI